MRRRHVIGSIALALLSACGPGASGNYFSPAAAVVNGQKISEERLSMQLRKLAADPQTRSQFLGSAGEANRIDAKREILNQMLQVAIVTQAASKLGVKVAESEVISRIESLEQNYGGKKKFDELLKKEGLFRSELRELLREQILYTKVGEAVTKDALPTEQNLLDFYEQNKATYLEQVHAAHILVCGNFNQETRQCDFKPEDEKLATDITKRARAGEDFAALARDHSKDPSNKDNGGDLGFFGRGRMTPDFEAMAFALAAPGDVSDPVKTEFGYHVIKLIAKGKSFEDSKEEIKQAVGKERTDQAYGAWLIDQFSTAKIRVNPKFGRYDKTSRQVVSTAPPRRAGQGADVVPGSGAPPRP